MSNSRIVGKLRIKGSCINTCMLDKVRLDLNLAFKRASRNGNKRVTLD